MRRPILLNLLVSLFDLGNSSCKIYETWQQYASPKTRCKKQALTIHKDGGMYVVLNIVLYQNIISMVILFISMYLSFLTCNESKKHGSFFGKKKKKHGSLYLNNHVKLHAYYGF